MGEFSDELWELVTATLDLAVDCFAAGEHHPMVCFVDASGQRHLVDVQSASGDITPELVESARDLIAQGMGVTAQRYAVAFDGYLTRNGERLDAAFVEAGERGLSEGIIFAQRYRIKKRSRKVERVGQPELVQFVKPLLT